MRICEPRKVFVTSAHEPGNFIAMPAVAFSSSDAELLSSYLREGCESSFAALVQAHQRMVLGTALRRTGDAEMARDVAQQVFALLARKAVWLAGRESLAGWLHRAARLMEKLTMHALQTSTAWADFR